MEKPPPSPLRLFGLTALVAALGLLRLAEPISAAPSLQAFPTAEGFGAHSRGGRGGRIIEVTNLNDAGEGSLRIGMEASGPRICVFRVSGTITLKNAIRVSSPYLTVAGQTSPGGVQLRGTGQPEGDWGVWFVNGAHDIIVRHLRVRMGGNMKHDAGLMRKSFFYADDVFLQAKTSAPPHTAQRQIILTQSPFDWPAP